MKIESIRGAAILLAMGLASIIVISFVMGASFLPNALADEQFTNRSIKGTWGYSASGDVIGVGPGVAVGLITADGKGGCTAKETLNIAPPIGTVVHNSTACAYNVNADGTGTAMVEFNPPFGGPVNVSFVIVNNKEILFIRTDPGFVFSGVVKRQSMGEDS